MKLLPTYKYLDIANPESSVWFSYNYYDYGIRNIFNHFTNTLIKDNCNDVSQEWFRFERRTKQDN